MKPAAPLVLRATQLLDQIRERIRLQHYSQRTDQGHSTALCIARRRLCSGVLADCSGPEADLRFAPKRTQSNPRLSRMCLQRNLDFSDEDNEVSNE